MSFGRKGKDAEIVSSETRKILRKELARFSSEVLRPIATSDDGKIKDLVSLSETFDRFVSGDTHKSCLQFLGIQIAGFIFLDPSRNDVFPLLFDQSLKTHLSFVQIPSTTRGSDPWTPSREPDTAAAAEALIARIPAVL